MRGREIDRTAGRVAPFAVSVSTTAPTPSLHSVSPSSCLFIALRIQLHSCIVISTTQPHKSYAFLSPHASPLPPTHKQDIFFFVIWPSSLHVEFWGRIVFSGGLAEGRGGGKDEGDKVTLDLLQKSILPESWAARRPVELSERRSCNITLVVRFRHCQLISALLSVSGPLIGRCISQVNVLLLERWQGPSRVPTKEM